MPPNCPWEQPSITGGIYTLVPSALGWGPPVLCLRCSVHSWLEITRIPLSLPALLPETLLSLTLHVFWGCTFHLRERGEFRRASQATWEGF